MDFAMADKFWNILIDILCHCGLVNKNSALEPQIVQLLCYAVFIVGFVVAVILLFIPAIYGRYSSNNTIWGFGINAKIAWFMQEIPAFAIPVSLWTLEYYNNHQHKTIDHHLMTTRLFLCGLFMVHYWQRSFIYSFLIRGGKPTPVGICFLAFAFCTVNGYIQGRSIQLTHFPNNWLRKPLVVIGIAAFFIGMAINIHSDHILRNLRKPGENGYKIPRGGIYEYVTAANYFGEAIEWLGFFMAVQTLAAAAFSFFTFANLVPRAIMHHRWYNQKFEDYPKDRKVFIPFIF